MRQISPGVERPGARRGRASSGRACALAGLLPALALILQPAPAWAQAGYYLTPSVSVAGGYDDNVFSAADQDDDVPPPPPGADPEEPPIIPERARVEDDLFLRVRPGLELAYRSEPLTIGVSYTIDGEAYLDHSSLSQVPVRQAANLRLQWLPTSRATFSLGGGWAETETPGELNAGRPFAEAGPAAGPGSPPGDEAPIDPTLTGGNIESGRRGSTAYTVSPGVRYVLSPLTNAHAGYALVRTEQDGGLENLTHSVTGALDRRVTPLDTARLTYGVRHFTSDDPNMQPPEPDDSLADRLDDEQTSHFVTLGWTRRITRALQAEVAGGPRFTEGQVDPEASATLTYQLQRGQLSFHYGRSQSVAAGVGGAIDSESFSGMAAYSLTQFLAAQVVASFSQNEQDRQENDVWRGTAQLEYFLREWLSVFLSYDLVVQDGTLDLFNPRDSPDRAADGPSQRQRDLSRSVVLLGVSAALPYRLY